MTRQDVIDCLPDDPLLPVIILVGDESDILDVIAEIALTHGTKYTQRNEVHILVNSDESRAIIRSKLCLSYIDPSCFNL